MSERDAVTVEFTKSEHEALEAFLGKCLSSTIIYRGETTSGLPEEVFWALHTIRVKRSYLLPSLERTQ